MSDDHKSYDSCTIAMSIDAKSCVSYTIVKSVEDKSSVSYTIALPDEEKEVDAIALGAEGNLYLMVYNPSKDTKGSYACEAYNM